MIINKNKVVSVIYELTLANNSDEIIESVGKNNPLEYLQGHGNLLPKFEANLEGLKIGDKFDFVLKCEDAYGPVMQEAIVDLPINVFEVDGQIDEELLTIDNIIPMMDGQGNRFNGRVLEVKEDNVKMDFNHPLAGADLHFKGEVVGIREASSEEILDGHIHRSSLGCNSEGCNCSTNDSCNGCN